MEGLEIEFDITDSSSQTPPTDSSNESPTSPVLYVSVPVWGLLVAGFLILVFIATKS